MVDFSPDQTRNSQSSGDQGGERIRSVHVSVGIDGRWKDFGEISLPSEVALRSSRTARAAARLSQSCPQVSATQCREFMRSVSLSAFGGKKHNIVGIHERVRRRDQEIFDIEVAQEALGRSLVSNEREVLPVVREYLEKGGPRQRLIALGGLVRGEVVDEATSEACVPLLNRERYQGLVLEILKLGQKCTRGLAHAAAALLGDALGDRVEERGPYYERISQALAAWCQETRDCSPLFGGINSPEAPTRAATLEVLSRIRGRYEESLPEFVEGLRDPSRVVVREALYALAQLGSKMEGYAQAIYDVAIEEDDYTGAVAIDLLAIIQPEEPEFLYLVRERLGRHIAGLAAAATEDLETDQWRAELRKLGPLATALVRLLPHHGDEARALLDILVAHPSEAVRGMVASACRVSPTFRPVEELLESLANDTPMVAYRALGIAATYGHESEAWFGRVEAALAQRLAAASGAQVRPFLALREMLNQFKGTKKAPGQES
jgi:HEAT repeat protein